MTKNTNQGKKRKAEDEELSSPDTSLVIEETPPAKKHKARKERQDTSPEKAQVETAKKKKKKTKEEDEKKVEEPAAKRVTKQKKDEDDNLKSKSPKKVKEEKVVKSTMKPTTTIANNNNDNKDNGKHNDTALDESITNCNLTQAELSVFGDFPDEWKKEEHLQLFQQVQSQLPDDDHVDYSRTLKKIDWSKVELSGRNSVECMAEYHCILRKLRKYKTMTEVLSDARKWIEEDSGKIKKPLLPQMLYYIAQRAKYIKRHPEMKLPEIAARLNKKFNKLSELKRQKYIDKYNEEMKTYKAEVTRAKKFAKPPKPPMVPMRVYIEGHYKGEKDSGKSKNDIYIKYKKMWQGLPKLEKVKYINKALELRKAYKEQLKTYCESYPEYKAPIKPFLTKSEQRIKDEFDGKPLKPPASGYMLFTKNNHDKFADVPFTDRTNQIAKAWKELDEAKKAEYIREAKETNEQYTRALKAFREKHPELEDDEEVQLKKQRKKQKQEMEARLKPVTKVEVKEEQEEEEEEEEDEVPEEEEDDEASSQSDS